MITNVILNYKIVKTRKYKQIEFVLISVLTSLPFHGVMDAQNSFYILCGKP